MKQDLNRQAEASGWFSFAAVAALILAVVLASAVTRFYQRLNAGANPVPTAPKSANR